MCDREPRPTAPSRSVIELVDSAAELVASLPDEPGPGVARRVGELLRAVERATPGGAPLHARLDTVGKWADALEQPHEHARFGGTPHVREHVLAQLRLTRAAVEDYFREQ